MSQHVQPPVAIARGATKPIACVTPRTRPKCQGRTAGFVLVGWRGDFNVAGNQFVALQLPRSTLNVSGSFRFMSCAIVNLMTDWERLQPAWDQFVVEHPKGCVFHTTQMIRTLEAAEAHRMMPLAAVNSSGEILALLVAVQVRTLSKFLGPVSSRSIQYAEPLCRDDEEGVDALTALLQEHDRVMRARVLFGEVRPNLAPCAERSPLERCGYEYLDYLNYVVDLDKPVDELWRNLGKSCRNKILRSERRGVSVVDDTTADGVDVLYHFLKLSYGRSGVPLAEKAMFAAAVDQFAPIGRVKIWVAQHHDRPVAAGILLAYRGVTYAWYGGSDRLRGIAPFDCLTWHEIKWARENGFRVYDFGGAGWPDEPYSVRDFKAKFGGQLVNHGRYRKVYSPWKFQLAKSAYAVGRSFISPT